MKLPLIASAALALSLAACSGPLSDGPVATVAAFNDAFFDTPFDTGAVSVLVRDANPLRVIQTYTMVPCREGAAICGGSAKGPAGVLTLQDGQYIVTGAYPGRTFYLDRNGDGFMGVGTPGADQVLVPLAWN